MSVQIKGKYTWLKHLDFLIVDLCSMMLAFVVSYRMKFGDYGFDENGSWGGIFIIICLLNVLIALFVNPYSGIFRRSYYMEIIKGLQLTIYNMVFTGVIIYLLKAGERYSREMFLVMYGIYFI